ncbi:transcription termination factor Rho, partial [Actinomyces sp. oral taxon 178 str. F0338]
MSNETSAEATTQSLKAMKLPELKALAQSRGLKGISQLRKPQLVELLSNDARPALEPAAPGAAASAQDPVPGAEPASAPAQDAAGAAPRPPGGGERRGGGTGRRGARLVAP